VLNTLQVQLAMLPGVIGVVRGSRARLMAERLARAIAQGPASQRSRLIADARGELARYPHLSDVDVELTRCLAQLGVRGAP
jgi:hypothetical protein